MNNVTPLTAQNKVQELMQTGQMSQPKDRNIKLNCVRKEKLWKT